MVIKLEGGGGKALMAWTLVVELFLCSFPKLSESREEEKEMKAFVIQQLKT